MGRRARRDEGAVPQVSGPRARYAAFRRRLHRRGGRRGRVRDAARRGTDVHRFHGRVLRPDLQPGREIPLHVRRQGGDAGRDSRDVRRRAARGCAALADAHVAVHAHPGAEGRVPVDAVRREGAADPGDPRRRSRDLPRAQAALHARGRRAGGVLCDSVRRGERDARRRRRNHRHVRPDGASRDGCSREAREGRHPGRRDRPAHHVAARRGDDPRKRGAHRARGGRRRSEPALLDRDRHRRARRAARVPNAEGADRARDRAAYARAVRERAGRPVYPVRRCDCAGGPEDEELTRCRFT
ncbi:LigA [Burkholderia sp. IT-111MI5]